MTNKTEFPLIEMGKRYKDPECREWVIIHIDYFEKKYQVTAKTINNDIVDFFTIDGKNHPNDDLPYLTEIVDAVE